MNFLKYVFFSALSLFIFSLSAPAADEVSSLEEAMKGISRDVMRDLKRLDHGEGNATALLKKADEEMEAYCKDKTGTLRITVATMEINGQGNLELWSNNVYETFNGIKANVQYCIILDSSEKDKAAKIKVGSRVTAIGKPWATIWSQSKSFRMNFCIHEATLK